MPARAAFFDVDETVIVVKSMFRFLEFHFERRGLPPSAYERVRDELVGLAAAGVPRAETNRRYYRSYAGRRADEVAAQGREWFAAELAAGGLFVAPVLDALAAHRAAGDLVGLVSGSFPPCVDPIAAHVGADLVLCTRPEIVGGFYTGEVARPAIGEEKGELVRAALAEHGIPAEASSAYGDHISDLPMLEAVGDPVVVGADPALRDVGAQRGWRSIDISADIGADTGAARVTGS